MRYFLNQLVLYVVNGLETLRNSHFDGLNVMFHFSAHCSKVLKSVCNWWQSSGDVMVKYKSTSMAYNLLIPSGKSLIKHRSRARMDAPGVTLVVELQ